MQYAQEMALSLPDAVDHKEGCPGHDKLSGILHPSGPSKMGMIGEKFDRFANALRNPRRRRGILLRNVVAHLVQVTVGAAGPPKDHFFPHRASFSQTSS